MRVGEKKTKERGFNGVGRTWNSGFGPLPELGMIRLAGNLVSQLR